MPDDHPHAGRHATVTHREAIDGGDTVQFETIDLETDEMLPSVRFDRADTVRVHVDDPPLVERESDHSPGCYVEVDPCCPVCGFDDVDRYREDVATNRVELIAGRCRDCGAFSTVRYAAVDVVAHDEDGHEYSGVTTGTVDWRIRRDYGPPVPDDRAMQGERDADARADR